MSPTGTLLVYSTPADINELRAQAAAVSSAWKTHDPDASDDEASGGNADEVSSPGASQTRPLETLTIEAENANIIARQLRPRFIFVLVGNLAPGQKQYPNITPEYAGDSRYPSETLSDEEIETLSEFEKDCKLGVLHVQRKRLDAMARYLLEAGYDKFVMPPEFD
jgi:hypothetical protein